MLKQNWNAKDYAKQSSAQFKWANQVINRIAINEQDTIIDIGCGDGKITALLSKKCKQIVGIDASENMIYEASVMFSKADYPNLSFCKMDATGLSFSNQFDVVFSNSALHWVEGQDTVLSGIYRSLKPRGRVWWRGEYCSV
jgi:trans-aconitate 2-methyltransferase